MLEIQRIQAEYDQLNAEHRKALQLVFEEIDATRKAIEEKHKPHLSAMEQAIAEKRQQLQECATLARRLTPDTLKGDIFVEWTSRSSGWSRPSSLSRTGLVAIAEMFTETSTMMDDQEDLRKYLVGKIIFRYLSDDGAPSKIFSVYPDNFYPDGFDPNFLRHGATVAV